MRILLRSMRFLGLAAIAGAIWLGQLAPAWAGAGGADLSGALIAACQEYGLAPCPTGLTINQQVVEDAALTGSTLNQVRTDNNIPLGFAVDGGTYTAGVQYGVNAPLYFVAPPNTTGTPIPSATQNANTNASLSAVTPPNNGNAPNGTADLDFTYANRTVAFGTGDTVGTVSLSLITTDANGNPINTATTTLNLLAGGGGSVNGTATGNFLGNGTVTDPLSELGITGTYSVDASGESLDLVVPLISPANFLVDGPDGSALTFDDMGAALDGTGDYIGLDPVASALTADLPDNLGDPLVIWSDLAIAYDGTTILSAAIPEPSTLSVLGGSLIVLVLRRRRRARR
jgi:hypothetical protein